MTRGSSSGFGFLSLQVKVPMKFNGSSGVQVRTPSDLQDLAAYTSLKFYIQNPEPWSRQRRQDGKEEGRFVLYLGSREVRRGPASVGDHDDGCDTLTLHPTPLGVFVGSRPCAAISLAGGGWGELCQWGC